MASLLSGRIVGPDGGPIGGASVYFTHGPVSLPDIAQITRQDGGFSLTAPVPGRYRLGVTAPGHTAHEQEMHVKGDAPMSLDIKLQADK